MKKKKLLIATDSFLPRWDGIARFLNEIIPHLTDKYDITVIAPKFGKTPFIENVKIVSFPVRKFTVSDYSPAKVSFFKIKKEIEKCDLLFVQTQGVIGMKSIILAKILKKPTLSFVHNIEWELFSKTMPRFRQTIRFFSKIYSRILYNMVDILMVPFLELKEIMKRHGINKPEMVVVKLGTNIDKFVPVDNKSIAKEKLGIDPNNIVIGFTGRLSREKDLVTLIKAFKLLKKEFNNITLLIVGKGLKSIEKELSLEKGVKSVGKKDEVLPYLQAMDIYVLPSLTETTSLSTIEAMSCGLPVIVTPVGYIKSYVKDKFNGLIFPIRNSLVLRLKLKQLIENTEFRLRLGKHARATVIKKFDWQKTIEKVKFLLDQF